MISRENLSANAENNVDGHDNEEAYNASSDDRQLCPIEIDSSVPISSETLQSQYPLKQMIVLGKGIIVIQETEL